MNNDTNRCSLPSLISGVLAGQKHYVDNLFADTWKELRFNTLLKTTCFTKRSGLQITQAVFLLLLWKWLNVSSIAMFSRKALDTFSAAKKDVMYDLLKREDINWREFNLLVTKEIYRANGLSGSRIKAFVLDDSIKARRGKRMEGVSSHFDHVTNRHVMGQQVLTLGLVTEEVFLPLDSQVYVSKTKAKGLNRPFKDGRSVVAKRYQEATEQGKPEMAANMMKRTLRNGLEADYMVADAWFGTKPMIRTALDLGVCPILRMKKNRMKYLAVTKGQKKELLDAKELYALAVKGEWKKVRGLPWKAVELEVELDLSEEKQQSPARETVKLLFVRGINEPGEPEVGKKDWALFLTTDARLSTNRMLEIYALRWGIEVYFKEAKQHLGFLSEQTASFASHTASIHLCAIRYLMLIHAKLTGQEARASDARANIQEQLDTLNFAGRLWQIFRAIISGSLQELQKSLGCTVDEIMQFIDKRVHDFFVQSLQLDAFTLQLEHD
jgi:hypothetical protein